MLSHTQMLQWVMILRPPITADPVFIEGTGGGVSLGAGRGPCHTSSPTPATCESYHMTILVNVINPESAGQLRSAHPAVPLPS